MSQITKQALGDALRHFLAQKPLNKITISDLTDHCGISRLTFYYHFEDIYDLVIWCCTENISKVLDTENLRETWQEGFLGIFHIMQEDRTLVLNVFRVMGRGQMEQLAAPLIHQVVSGVIETESRPYHISEEDKAVVTRCYGYVFSGVILDWIQNGMTVDPAAIVKRLDTLLGGSIPLALSHFSDKI